MVNFGKGIGLSSDQLIDTMLRVKRDQRIYYVSPTTDYHVRLFRKILNDHNPSYAVAVSPMSFSIPHVRAMFMIVSLKSHPRSLQIVGRDRARIVLDHACMMVDPRMSGQWISYQEELRRP